MKLKAGCEEEYRRRHAALWPEMKALLSQSGVSNYSIFFDSETHLLFAYQEVEGEQGSQDLGDQEVVRRWWAYMADIMEVNPDLSPVSTPLDNIFYLP